MTYNVLVAGTNPAPRNAITGHLNAASNTVANTVPDCGAVAGAISNADKEFDAVLVDADDSSAKAGLIEATDIHGLAGGVYTGGKFLTDPGGFSAVGADVFIHAPDSQKCVLKAVDHLVAADGRLRATMIHPTDPSKTVRTDYGDPVLLNPPNALFLDGNALPDWARHGGEVVVADEAGGVRYSADVTDLATANDWIQYSGR